MVTWLLLGGLGIGAGAGAYAIGRRWPCSTAVLVPLLAVLLVVRALLDARPDWEWALLPWPGYAMVQGLWLYALAVTFFGVAAARLPVRWNRAVVLALGLVVLSHGLDRHRHLAWPEQHGDDRVAGPDHHLRQSTMHTCGPAACVAALSHLGERRSERQMAELCRCRRGGSRLFDLYRGVVMTLDEERFVVSIENLDAHALLQNDTVVVASNGSRAHAIAVVTRGGVATVHDPLAKAPEVWSAEQLQRDYRPPAIVIRRRPPAASPR